MGWVWYQVRVRLKSPVHIGWRKLGNLLQTRPYVWGRAIWGALTVSFAESRCGDYQKTGEIIRSDLILGYFWPCEKDKNICFPWKMGNEKWEFLFLDSTIRAAQDAATGTVAEGMLYEAEYIAPFTREGTQVDLVGPIALKGNSQISKDSLEKAFSQIRIGGDRSYGWGRIECVSFEPLKNQEPYPGWRIEQGDEQGDIFIPSKEGKEGGGLYLPCHLKHTEKIAIEGNIEPIFGWEKKENGFQLSKAEIAWAPGAQIKQKDIRLRIRWDGVLELVSAG